MAATVGRSSAAKPKAAKPEASAKRPRMTAGDRRRICERIAAGETLAAICDDPAMPERAQVLRALARNAGFRRSFRVAERLRADLWAEEILLIADRPAETGGAVRGAALQRAKLQVEVRKWLLQRKAESEPAPDAGAGSDGSGGDCSGEGAASGRPDLRELTREERDVLRAILERRAGRSRGRA